MLAIEVTFLTGRYVATSYSDRRRAEWPPHPARLFSALAATHLADEAPAPTERAALEWLQALDAPELAVSDASERDTVTVFVPVNDGYVLKNFDGQSGKLEGARAAAALGDKKAGREVARLEKKLLDDIAKEVAMPPNPGKDGPAAAFALLPDSRIRQPRTFPSVTPHEPRATFMWPDAQPTDEQRTNLDALLARLVRLGHSSSLVSARLLEKPPAATLVPAAVGERLRTTGRAQLAALEAAFALHRETEPRVMPARFQSYARSTDHRATELPISCFSEDWLVLRRADGVALPMIAGPGIARAVRAALMSGGGDGIPEILSGHRVDRTPSERDHLAVVPLPFVGHEHADGGLLGVALVLPRGATADERAAVYRAVVRWEARAREHARNQDVVEDAPPLVQLLLGQEGVWWLERVEGLDKRATLQARTWCGPATTWASVTPVALDRNPGDLRTRDAGKLARVLAEAEEIVVRACTRIGLPTPGLVEVLPAAPFAGSAKARRYERVKSGSTQRVLTHVRVTFSEPVSGPVLIGAGRYHGLGLLRPVPQGDCRP
ncbi:MAG: type I-U CRISPR-associated protein Cas5/Cas6 [Polyangiaceae bacterium]|nr:type I-U CRISPR-associated protein Cas5/Cas6 [Polyangiaceae bacterium]